jgi:hypothetical protein
MLRSFLAPASNGQIILRREILSHLGITANGILYGALYPEERTFICSPIPFSSWVNAYKVIIHTEHMFGSLAKAANAVSSLNMNIISSWASTESHKGHLCSTSIVIIDEKSLQKNGGLPGQTKKLIKLLDDRRTQLHIFNEDRLLSVRLSPLSILHAYYEELRETEPLIVEISNHTLRFNSTVNNPKKSPWRMLLQATGIANSSTCILTTDTEEAFLRITVVPESARLLSLSFQLLVQSATHSFAGYWTNALNLLAQHKYSIYIAHNLLIKKSDNTLPSEEAEFRFIVDNGESGDITTPIGELQDQWFNRLNSSFELFAKKSSDLKKITTLRLSRPNGIGVLCFFATNAKPRSGVSSDTAIQLCRKLEGCGFKPVNVDFARGNINLADQVVKLVESCRFMVILDCPEERLKVNENEYRVSEWVLFEEVLMSANRHEILRVRFNNVKSPVYRQGFTEVVIPETGITDDQLEDFGERILRWTPLMWLLDADNVNSSDIPVEILAKDLVSYYTGK